MMLHKGGDSSGTDSVHAASAGGYEPTHHAPHPESHNESLGVRSSTLFKHTHCEDCFADDQHASVVSMPPSQL